MSESTNELTSFNLAVDRLERLAKLLTGCLVLILSGALWAARLEMRVNYVENLQAQDRPRLSTVELTLAHLQGKLQATAKSKSTDLVGKIPTNNELSPTKPTEP